MEKSFLVYEDLKQALIQENFSEAEALKYLKKLHELFTIKRSQLENYSEDKNLVSAYSLFYLPTNVQKFFHLLSQVSPELILKITEGTFIDYGTGPGTYLLGLLKFLEKRNLAPQKMIGVDLSSTMIMQAKKLLEYFYPNYKNYHLGKATPPISGFKTLLLGNMINEIDGDEVKQIISKISPDILMIIDLGTPALFKKILELRSFLKNEGFTGIFPCSSIDQCPLEKYSLKDFETKGWCHSIWRGVHDSSIERLSQTIKLDRKFMPFLGHVYSRAHLANRYDGTFIRFLKETKISFYWEICTLEHKIKKLELLKKNFNKEQLKKMKKISVGLKINFEVLQERDQETIRGRLIFPEL